jgi:hypothetical protein
LVLVTVSAERPTMDPKASYLTAAQAADLAGVSRPTIHAWATRYNLGRRIGCRWRFDPVALRHFLDGTQPEQAHHSDIAA